MLFDNLESALAMLFDNLESALAMLFDNIMSALEIRVFGNLGLGSVGKVWHVG